MKIIEYTNNIKVKLGILFLILCISIAVLSYKAVSVSEYNKDTLKLVHSKSQDALSIQKQIITPLYKVRELTQSLVMAPNKQLRKDIEKSLNDLLKSLDKQIKDLAKKDAYVLQNWAEYKTLINNTKEFLQEEFEEGAYINVTTSSRQKFTQLLDIFLGVQKQFLNNSTIVYKQASQEAKSIKIDIFIIIVVVLILAIFIGWLIASNIINSIQKVQLGLSDFFEYLHHRKAKTKKIQINSKDEFYQMANMINTNVQKIQNNIQKNDDLVRNATKVLEDLKGGNLSSRLTLESNNQALNELKAMMNNMIDNLELQIQNEINKRLEQEQLLIQQSKLASMGEMIGNIAHQWRQPLTQLSAILMNMKVTYDFDNFSKQYLNTKVKEANVLTNYMSQTISDFQNFFKPHGQKEEFSIQKACKDAYFIVESSLKYHGFKVNFDVIEDSMIYGYKNEYSQVILNILSNAKDVILDREIANPKIDIQIKVGDNYGIVKIQDNAGGIKSDILDKIFEPYFTTRHKTQGTGIGLYMSKNIIETNMQGFINVRNDKDGALFTIKVPKK